ncbi:MAG: MFS transporter [Syntrophomonadaceae bacterium]|jgi:MFS family permease
MNLLKKLGTPLGLFALASLLMGMYTGLYDPSFNNYLAQVHHVGEIARGGLEFPRELPGFLVIFVFASLIFLPDTRIAMVSALLVGLSLFGQAYLAPGMVSVVIWMIIWSTGAHLFMAVSSVIGLRLADEGHAGRRLGQLTSMESLGTLAGMIIVYFGASQFNFSFATIFTISGSCAMLAALSLFIIKPQPLINKERSIVLKREYSLYYLLSILFGARKQIFLTFAPWVLIKIYHCDVSTFAVLGLLGTLLSFLLRPLLGKAVDAIGERPVITAESILLVVICTLYGFAPDWFSTPVALFTTMACYITDQLLFSVRMARTTYLYRIVVNKGDIGPTISMGLTLDHAVSMTVPFWGGLLWAAFGFRWVFLAAALIALVNLIAAKFIPDLKERPAVIS